MTSRLFPSLLLLTALLFSGVSCFAQAQAVEATQDAVESKVEIEWLTFDEAMKRMETEPRKIMIDVYTDWCGWCKRMDATTFHDPQIVQYVTDNYYAVKFDAEQKESIFFKGKEYKFVPNGRRGYHELAAGMMNGRMSYPTVVYMDESSNVLQAIPGFKQAKEQDQILKFWGDNAYKETTWENFLKGYQSPY